MKKKCARAPKGRWVVLPRKGPPSVLRFSHVAAMVSTTPVPVQKPNRVRNTKLLKENVNDT